MESKRECIFFSRKLFGDIGKTVCLYEALGTHAGYSEMRYEGAGAGECAVFQDGEGGIWRGG